MTVKDKTMDDLLFPSIPIDNWQMMQWDRIALTGILSRLRPKCALEIGVYFGGSLALTSQYAERIIAIDIDPAVLDRFAVPANADLRIGNSVDLIPSILDEITKAAIPLNYVLIDADHSAEGVRRDIELVLEYKPIEPMFILIHDSGNPECRRGICAADWNKSRYVQSVECDFVPGQVIEHSVKDGKGEVWGGLAVAYLTPTERHGAVQINQAAKTSIEWLHKLSPASSSIFSHLRPRIKRLQAAFLK